MNANTYLLKVTFCEGTRRDNSVLRKIKLAINHGLSDYDLKEKIKSEIGSERKITIVARKKVKKGLPKKSLTYL
ncbi:MAG: hypothetical protein PHS49_00880 [Candidatus Gracilibacteria bacterium]|nr:hypothetical protein [Candidatus Gracilibacteria bacterium]